MFSFLPQCITLYCSWNTPIWITNNVFYIFHGYQFYNTWQIIYLNMYKRIIIGITFNRHEIFQLFPINLEFTIFIMTTCNFQFYLDFPVLCLIFINFGLLIGGWGFSFYLWTIPLQYQSTKFDVLPELFKSWIFYFFRICFEIFLSCYIDEPKNAMQYYCPICWSKSQWNV